MSDPIVKTIYNGYNIVPAPTFSYSTELVYANDLVIGYSYKITLNGYCIPPADDGSPSARSLTDVFNNIAATKNIFSSNGGTLAIYYNENPDDASDKPVIYATDIKILSINFNESNNYWSKFVPYTIELQSNNIHMGTDLTSDPSITEMDILIGNDDPLMADSLHSTSVVNVENHKIKNFSENFNIDIDDNIYNQLNVYVDYNPSIIGNTTRISNNYYTISLTISATGKHDTVLDPVTGNKYTLPAWEHAKRFVHRRLSDQLSRISNNFLDFMKHGTKTTLDQIHNTSIQSYPLIDHSLNPARFGLYDETINFSVSESEGTFEATYNAIVKQNCQQIGPTIGCSNTAIHTVTKSVNKAFNANEQTNTFNQEISISLNGEIRGLVRGYNIGQSNSSFILDNFTTGSFLTLNPFTVGGGTRKDKNSAAEALFNTIFDYNGFDLKPEIKTALGVTHTVLAINPAATIRPSKMTLTRNFIDGTINYSAEYNNSFNCPTNHFSVDISVEEPTPIINEFIIVNNNNNELGNLGFPVIQDLGTQTAKKINVTINGNVGEDFNKCCLGADNNWNLLNPNHQFFSLTDFQLPPDLILPVLDPSYVLTSKTKKVTYPQGNFTISLAYTCSTVCDIGNIVDCPPCP